MTKLRFIRIAAIVLGALTIAGAALSAFGPERIVLSEAQLQERINRELPRQFRGVTVERVMVSLADGRISLRVEARATALGEAFAVTTSARGVPRYDAERGEIFFEEEDVALEDFTIGGLRKQVRAFGERLDEGIEQNLPPVKAVPPGLLRKLIEAYLAARPVYRFKDDLKGLVLKATIKDITIVGDTLAIGVSLIKLSTAVGGWLFGLALVVLLGIWSWSVPARATLPRAKTQ